MKKRLSLLLLITLSSLPILAQLPVVQDFRGTTAPGWTLGNSAFLTAAGGIDGDGSGWLRLTRNNYSEVGYTWLNQDFSSTDGLIVEFDFVEWSSNFQGADGMSLVFYDAADGAFTPGDGGGALGYIDAPGNVFLGVGISGTYPASFTGSAHTVGVRSSKSFSMPSLATGSLPSTNLGFGSAGTRPTDGNPSNNRRIRVKWSVDDSLLIDLKAGEGDFVRIISIGNLSTQLVMNPSSFRIALVGSNGGLTAFHEIRDVIIDSDVTTKTSNATLVTETTARLNGYVYAITGPTTVQFSYGTQSGNLTESVAAAQSPLADSGYFAVHADLTELTPDTRYFYQVEATNDSGAFSGGEVALYTFPTEPDTQPSLLSTSPSSRSATIRWTPAEGTETLVLMNSQESFEDFPTDGTFYNATGSFETGPVIGGSVVVYSGPADSVQVTGLIEETNYTILLYSYHPGSFGKPNYLTVEPGTGGFTTEPLPFTLVNSDFSNGHLSSVLADMNNDGNLDIVSFGDFLYVTMADGEGGYQEPFNTDISNGSYGLVALNVADFNNDGLTDIFFNGYSVSGILLNGGEGPEWVESETFPTGYNPISTVLDFNRDGLMDILLSNSSTPNFLLFVNTGSGFNQIELDITGRQMGAIAVADFNMDGYQDFLFTGSDGNAYSGREAALYLNGLGQTFYPASFSLPGVHFGDVKAADFNNDAWPDFIYSGSTGDGGRLLVAGINDQDGGFTLHTRAFVDEEGPRKISREQAPSTFELPDPMAAVGIGVADFNMDGLTDVILSGTIGGEVQGQTYIWLNAGESGFVKLTDMPFPDMYVCRISTGDINSDGTPDVLVTGSAYSEESTGYYLFANGLAGSNSSPDTPSDLFSEVEGNSASLSWDAATDDKSNSLQYAVRVGTSLNGNEVLSVVTDEVGTSGIPGYQNAGFKSDLIVNSLAPGRYYWQVQAIDAGLSASGFSEPDSFDVSQPIPIGPPSGLTLYMDGDTLVAEWNPVEADSLKYYHYYLGTSPGNWLQDGFTEERNPYDNTVRFTDLGAGVRYFVTVASVDTMDSEGPKAFARSVYVPPFKLIYNSYFGNYRESMVAADLNQDGLMDIITTGQGGGGQALNEKGGKGNKAEELSSQPLNVLLNSSQNVEAEFFTEVPSGFESAEAVAVADFNGDTKPDIIAIAEGGVYLLINYIGDEELGPFQNQLISESYFVYGYPDLVVGDFDNNMRLDVAIISQYDASILYQTDFLEFYEQSLSLEGIDDGSIAAADVDLDGDLDLLISGEHYSEGGGEFLIAAVVPTGVVTLLFENVGGETGWELVENTGLPGVYRGGAEFADFTGDGYPDVVLSGRGENGEDRNFGVFRNNGDKTFTQIHVPGAGLAAGNLKTGDLNNDGLTDFVVLGAYIGQNYYSMNAYLNNGDETFTALDSTTFNPVYNGDLVLGDLDGDSDLDIVVTGNFRIGGGGGEFALTGSTKSDDHHRTTLEELDGNYLAVFTNRYANELSDPMPPTEVLVSADFDTLTVSFNAGSDEETPVEALTYNIRVVSADSLGYFETFAVGSDSETGFSYLAQSGMVGSSKSWSFTQVPDGNYYVSVQTVDASFRTSTFTAGVFVTVNHTVPVELATFDFTVDQQTVTLNWTTRTETANAGFNIQRQVAGDESWQSVGFIQGNGTSTEPRAYQFSDKPGNGSFRYRLEQVDLDGSVTYSSILDVVINKPAVYALDQNYPNPFNPSTRINYSIASPGQVNLSLYDVLGRKVQVLVNEVKPAGSHFFDLDARSLSSGVYFYRIESGNFTQIRKMTLVK